MQTSHLQVSVRVVFCVSVLLPAVQDEVATHNQISRSAQLSPTANNSSAIHLGHSTDFTNPNRTDPTNKHINLSPATGCIEKVGSGFF